jgi:molybdopterin converting factor small subunit
MLIHVQLFARYRAGRPAEQVLELASPASVRGLVAELALPGEPPGIILVNERHGGPDTLLRDGDQVALYPPIGGG